jgi:plastocyanin
MMPKSDGSRAYGGPRRRLPDDPTGPARRIPDMALPTHRLAAALVAATAAVLPWVTPASAAAPSTASVILKDISFKRATVRIAPGGRVTWTWRDGPSPHNVTFAHQHSATKTSGTYTRRFLRAGTFRYHCTIHPGMDGKVVVA